MFTILVFVVGAMTMLVFVVLAVVVVGIKQEPSAEELASQPSNVLTAWVRRLLGVYVRKPDHPSTFGEGRVAPRLNSRDPARWPKGPAK
jgi:hypothetical protein